MRNAQPLALLFLIALFTVACLIEQRLMTAPQKPTVAPELVQARADIVRLETELQQAQRENEDLKKQVMAWKFAADRQRAVHASLSSMTRTAISLMPSSTP